jgi:hypothetical protein
VRMIWKHTLCFSGGEQLVRTMPKGSIPVYFGMQGGAPTIWCECNPDASMEDRRFVVAGTGHPLAESGVYIGSCQDGAFVWHAYEIERPSSGK